MESKVGTTPEIVIKDNGIQVKYEYREEIRKHLNDEFRKIYDLEIQNAAKILIEEHKKAIKQVVEEYRSVLHQVVEEEKAEIWKKAETLKKSMLKLGL
ncbi:MAG: hypothetical protein WBQ62_06485 [Dehalococcoidales bacterium]